MLKYGTPSSVVFCGILLLSASSIFSAETWRLGKDEDWKAVSATADDKFVLAVAEIKKSINAGQCHAVRPALLKLKEDFPEIAGPDLDAFIEAEMLFCRGKFTKAARSYDRFVSEYPESRLYEAALDRQFAIATAFLAGQKRPVLGVFKIRGYAEGARIMGTLSDRAGDAPVAVRAAVAVAKSLESRKKFNEAYQKWSEISSRWPMGQIGKEALLAMARCKHAAYKGPKYDDSSLISARSYYQNFKLRFPEDAEQIGVDKRLEQITEQLAYKQFEIGRYYQQTGNRQSANLYYQMVVDNWPDTTAAKMAKKMFHSDSSHGEKEKNEDQTS